MADFSMAFVSAVYSPLPPHANAWTTDITVDIVNKADAPRLLHLGSFGAWMREGQYAVDVLRGTTNPDGQEGVTAAGTLGLTREGVLLNVGAVARVTLKGRVYNTRSHEVGLVAYFPNADPNDRVAVKIP